MNAERTGAELRRPQRKGPDVRATVENRRPWPQASPGVKVFLHLGEQLIEGDLTAGGEPLGPEPGSLFWEEWGGRRRGRDGQGVHQVSTTRRMPPPLGRIGTVPEPRRQPGGHAHEWSRALPTRWGPTARRGRRRFGDKPRGQGRTRSALGTGSVDGRWPDHLDLAHRHLTIVKVARPWQARSCERSTPPSWPRASRRV